MPTDGAAAPRTALVERTTKETEIRISLALDGAGESRSETGIPFFDHMVAQLGKHGGFDLDVVCRGDLSVDTHHTIEDVGIALGDALRQALGDKAGVRRFASVAVPLDETLVEVALDLSGRPFLFHDAAFGAEVFPLGTPGFEPQLAEEFWRAFATAVGITLHVVLVRGKNTHHILEAQFKAVARALRDAVRVEGTAVPSTKGVLEPGGVLAVIAVLDYGIGNLGTAERVLVHLGGDARLCTTAEACEGADGVVLPGVGAFGRCMGALRESGLDAVAHRAVEEGTPLLAVCVGLQLLFEGSEEASGVPGLGILQGEVRRLPEGVKRPQMQWNRLDVRRPSPLFDGVAADRPDGAPWVYFTHSYSAHPADDADVLATCDYGGPVVAAVERGRVWATQFHPEKSGRDGLALLRAFLAITASARTS